ncbi:MAG: SGNH/GDSL hydrolase family protein [Acutalibacteraceae bacterium]
MIDYSQMNEVAKRNGIVFLGSSYLESIPVNELAQDFETDLPVYNRSVEGLTIDKACDMLDSCVLELNPSKVFISIGDEDVKKSDLDIKSFIEKYQWLLYTLHSRSNAKIYIVSVLSDAPAASLINEKLKKTAKETGCQYVDVSASIKSEKPGIRLFDTLRFYMRSKPITFGAAMSAAF